MKSIVFCNGRFVEPEKAQVSALDRGLLYGDGVFTTLRVCDGKVELFEPHLKRLAKHCRELGIEPPRIHNEWIQELITRNGALEGIWRLKIIITGGEGGKATLEPREHGSIIMQLSTYKPPKGPLRMGLSEHPIDRPTARIKSLAYLDRLWLCREAEEREFDDLVVCNGSGIVLESAYSNLFWCYRNILYTPESSLPLLRGVFLDVVLDIADSMHLKVKEVEKRVDDIPSSANLFACNALSHVVAVKSIGQMQFSRDRRMEDEIKETCQDHVRRNLLDCSWAMA